MATELGKTLRKIRIDEDERLLDMAKRLGKSAAFLSAVEVGKKSPPSNFEELIIAAYKLRDTAAEGLRIAADRSRQAFTISPRSEIGRDTAGLLARKMDTLSDDELIEIKNLLSRSGKDARD